MSGNFQVIGTYKHWMRQVNVNCFFNTFLPQGHTQIIKYIYYQQLLKFIIQCSKSL